MTVGRRSEAQPEPSRCRGQGCGRGGGGAGCGGSLGGPRLSLRAWRRRPLRTRDKEAGPYEPGGPWGPGFASRSFAR